MMSRSPFTPHGPLKETMSPPHVRGNADPREDYWDEVQHIQTSDIGARSEIILRYMVIVLAGIVLVYATGDVMYAGWSAGYVLINGVYSFWLSRMRSPVNRVSYLGLIVLNVLSSSLYTVMPLYLWFLTDDLGLKILGLCGMIGLAIYNLARHARYTIMAFWDLFLITATTMFVGVAQIMIMPTLGGQICVAFGTLALIVFYYGTKSATIRDREALASSREDLIEVQKQATMGQITAGVAHDCNNKLTAIQGNIELAALTHDPAERAALLREARQSCNKAAEVVANMQAFVRRSPLQITQIEMSEFTTTFRRSVMTFLPETMSFALQVDDSLDRMSCDQNLLESALLNLILNARDAMEGQGGQITLRIAPGDLNNWSGKAPTADGPLIRFDVADEGPGIDVQAFGLVQEPFFSTKPVGMGTGLGLSMVKGFTEQIGGALKLRNRQHGGLEVSLILPKDSTP